MENRRSLCAGRPVLSLRSHACQAAPDSGQAFHRAEWRVAPGAILNLRSHRASWPQASLVPPAKRRAQGPSPVPFREIASFSRLLFSFLRVCFPAFLLGHSRRPALQPSGGEGLCRNQPGPDPSSRLTALALSSPRPSSRHLHPVKVKGHLSLLSGSFSEPERRVDVLVQGPRCWGRNNPTQALRGPFPIAYQPEHVDTEARKLFSEVQKAPSQRALTAFSLLYAFYSGSCESL